MTMFVIKRDGNREEVKFDKILARIEALANGFDSKYVDVTAITKKVIDGIYDEIKTSELDDLAANMCASMATIHPDMSRLAGRIAVSNLHKLTDPSFTNTMRKLYGYIEPNTGKHSPYISENLLNLAIKYEKEIDKIIDHSKDYEAFDYFGIKTLQKGYLNQIGGEYIERPQHLFMRVALSIHEDNIEKVIETYKLTSNKHFTHATPTLFNAGSPKPQMSSCFLIAMNDDSIPGIYKTLTDAALISQSSGGVGIHIHNIRASGAFIAGSRGYGSGIVPMLKTFNETAQYVNQGGKRKGSFCIYIEPWHADIEDFLDLRKNHGAEERRTRDLFNALWIPDKFMQRVEEDGEWTLMCPRDCPGLSDVYGKEFDTLYEKYEKEGRGRKTIGARALWAKITSAQIETGQPFMLYKDACNTKSNQKNLGTIKSSNLCTEIIEYSDKNETAVCNLGSIAVNSFVKEDKTYDFEKLHYISKVLTKNLNTILDKNQYILPETKTSNLKHRPIGMGVQGLADTFAMMKLSFDEPRARELNKQIFETIYHGAIEASIELAKEYGPYESFKGSPASQGQFQFDLWNVMPDSGMYNWEKTRKEMVEHGLRNSLLIALMPTASTAQMLGNNEAIEPFTSNMYVRRVLSGEFVIVNKHLLKELIELGLWDENMRHKLMAANGSVQDIDEIPEDLKERYRTVFEIPQKSVIDMAADRSVYICQSTSMNIFIRGATASKLNALHFYAWKRGLKTGMYYLRNTPARGAVKFTVDRSKVEKKEEIKKETPAPIPMQPSIDDDNICLSCGS